MGNRNQFHTTDTKDFIQSSKDSKIHKWPRGADISKGIPGVTRSDVCIVGHQSRVIIDTLFLSSLAKLTNQNTPLLPADFLKQVVQKQDMGKIRDKYPDTPKPLESTTPFYNQTLVDGNSTSRIKMPQSLFSPTHRNIRALMRSGTYDQWHALRAVQTWMGLQRKFDVYPMCRKYIQKCCSQLLPLLRTIPDYSLTRHNHYPTNGSTKDDPTTGMSCSSSTTMVCV